VAGSAASLREGARHVKSKKNGLDESVERAGSADSGVNGHRGGAGSAGESHEEVDVVYDSMEAALSEGDEVIELYDINAVVGRATREQEREGRRPTPTPYSLANPDPSQPVGPRDGPSYDGVIDGETLIDGRAVSLARGQRRDGALVHAEAVTPEVPPSAFLPGILAFTDPNHPALSQFRQLKIKIEDFSDQLQYRSIAVTSTRAGEGTTSTALNLAIVMSENPWLKLALLDLNFRNPVLGRLMQAPNNDPGLLQLLSGRASFEAVLKKLAHRNLYFLHTGGVYEESMKVLNSPQFDVFLDRMYDSFDLVIIDAPPALRGDDALVIKQKVDGVFLVLRAEATPLTEMNKAVGRLGRDRILGVVLNRVRPREVG